MEVAVVNDKGAISLAKLSEIVSDAFSAQLGRRYFWVLGEISDLRYNLIKDYYYFSLVEKDEKSDQITTQFSAKVWSNISPKIKSFEKATGQKFADKIRVMVLCEVTYHKRYGLSLNVLDVDPSFTLGNLALARQGVINRLVEDVPGVVDVDGELQTPNKQLSLPQLVKQIALITAIGSDAYQDFMNELTRNRYGYHFHVVPYYVPVQGNEAIGKIVRALQIIEFNASTYDAVVIIRGGGAGVELATFDTYELARAVALFPIPVITGIGHDRNESVCDLVACVKTKTPTKAAETIVQNNHALEMYFREAVGKVYSKIDALIRRDHEVVGNKIASGLNAINQQLMMERKVMEGLSIQVRRIIMNKIEGERRGLRSVLTSVYSMVQLKINESKQYAQMIDAKVRSVDPDHLLERGFALVSVNGKLFTRAEQLVKGTDVDIRFIDGTRKAKIT